MAQNHAEISAEIRKLIEQQSVFFVATAPLSPDGHVNVSPKGLAETLRILSPTKVAYLDITGSGNETAAHLAENGRITVMFCTFEGNPKIVRLYGRGRVALPGSGEYADLRPGFPEVPGVRQIIVVDVELVRTSCGFGVPLMELRGEREEMAKWAEKKGEEGLRAFRRKYNARSLDGREIELPPGDVDETE